MHKSFLGNKFLKHCEENCKIFRNLKVYVKKRFKISKSLKTDLSSLGPKLFFTKICLHILLHKCTLLKNRKSKNNYKEKLVTFHDNDNEKHLSECLVG